MKAGECGTERHIPFCSDALFACCHQRRRSGLPDRRRTASSAVCERPDTGAVAGTLHGPGDPARIAACEPVSAHTVRRSFAANFLKAKDVPLAAISKALGHSKIAAAMRYLRVDVWACGALRFSPGAAASDCLPGLATDRIPGISSYKSSYTKEKALNISAFSCPGQESNLHALRHTHLKRARLPIPPPGRYRSFPELRCAKVILFFELPTLFCEKNYLLKNLY